LQKYVNRVSGVVHRGYGVFGLRCWEADEQFEKLKVAQRAKKESKLGAQTGGGGE
jgi:hypothetical protein